MVQLNLGPNVAAEEGGCPEEHTGTKCETWRTLCAGRVAYTDPGPFAGAELVSFSPGTLGRGRAKALTDESDVLGNRAATALRLLPPPPITARLWILRHY